jgi:ribosomal-protein-alanine N-acetyltransferase
MIIFETERLIVRHYEHGDEANFFTINSDEEIVRYIRKPKTKEESAIFFSETLFMYHHQSRLGRWAVNEKSNGGFIGSFAIIPVPTDTARIQIGYALLKPAWGMGYATELTSGGLLHAKYHLALSLVYAYAESGNIASQKVLLKAGFAETKRYKEEEKEVIEYQFGF